MDQHVTWSLAETGYILGGVAAVAGSWSLWRLAPRDRETALLCGSVLALAVYYGCLAVDAFLHATHRAASSTSVWVALGHTALFGSGALFIALLVALVTKLQRFPRPQPYQVQVILAQIVIGGSFALVSGLTLVWTLVDGDAPLLASRLETIEGFQSGLLMLCFLAPLGLLRALFEQAPGHGKPQWPRWVISRWGSAAMRASADDADIEPEGSRAHHLRRLAFVFLMVGWLATSPWVLRALGSTSWSVAGAAILRLLLLPSLLAFVHHYSPFVFFDVLIKRGVIWSALALVVTTVLFFGFEALPADAQTWLPLASVGITLLLGMSSVVFITANVWLDTALFHRADYRTELTRLMDAMARSSSADAIVRTVTRHLTEALRSTFVRFDTTVVDTTDIVIGVGTADRPRGFLVLGPRTRGQHYGSEDLTFIDAVAGQLAAHLEAFEAREAAHLATVAELRALRAQINPHFLFNAFNTLAELSRGQAAERTIVNLSHVFRYVLESTQHERVRLGAELDAIRAYLEIEAERFEERLRFAIEAPEETREALIPPMLLQPLVENAVKHGISGKVSGGTVRVGAVLEDQQLRITVQDDGVGFDLDRTPRRVGLTNVGARVERTGGSWRVLSIPGAGTLINVTVASS